MSKLSIRWQLILSTFAVAFGIACSLIVVFELRTHEHLLAHLEKTLATESEEIIAVLGRHGSSPTLEALREINSRLSPYTYFYQMSDVRGRLLLKSDNLEDASLPLPGALREGATGSQVYVDDVPYPGRGGAGELVRVRTERVRARSGWGAEDLLVQVAVSLQPVRAMMRRDLVHAVAYGGLGLGAVLFLLWFVTARSLRRVSLLTQRASRIGATNLRERLPLSGTGDELDQLAAVLNGMLERLQRSLQQM